MGPYYQSPGDDFPQIKRDLIRRVEQIERYVNEGNQQRKKIMELLEKIEKKIYGDDDSDPPRKGIERRLKELEEIEDGREKQKKDLVRVIVGATTIAVGTAMLWVFTAIRDAFLSKGGH